MTPLVEEKLYLIRKRDPAVKPLPRSIRLTALKELPLILPSGPHGLRALVDKAFARARANQAPLFIAEADVTTGERAPVQCADRSTDIDDTCGHGSQRWFRRQRRRGDV